MRMQSLRGDFQFSKRTGIMRAPHLDILKRQSDGTLRWIETAGDVREAEERLAQLAGEQPGEYFVFDQKSQKIVAKVER